MSDERVRRLGAAVLLVAAVAVSGSVAPARAEDEGHVRAGVGWWYQDEPEAKLREFRDLPREFFVEEFAYEKFGPLGAVSVFGEQVALQDGFYGLAARKGVRWQLEGSYRYTPHLFSQIARTGYTEITPGVLLLPDNLQEQNEATPANYNTNMTKFLANAGFTDLGIETNVLNAELRARPMTGWKFDLRGERRSRAGHKAYGGPFGRNSTMEILEPVDHSTVEGEALAHYRGGPVAVQASLGASVFENHIDRLFWDNPKRITDRIGSVSSGDGSQAGQLDLYPDNKLLRGAASLSWQLPKRTNFSATAAVARGTQDDAFLPHTVNTAILSTVPGSNPSALPASSLDAEAIRLVLDGRLRTRMVRNVTGTLRAHLEDYDNQTDQLTFFGRAVIDQSWDTDTLSTHPVSHKQQTVGADIDWNPLPYLGLTATGEIRARERTYREIENDDEYIYGAKARVRPVDDLSFEAGWRHANRIPDEFITADYQNPNGSFFEVPGLRRYDVATRRQDLGEADATWSPTSRFDLSVNYDYLRNEYPESQYGLQYEETHSVIGQAALDVVEQVSVHGGYGLARANTDQRSVQSSTIPAPVGSDWTALVQDRNDFAFAGAEWGVVPGRLTLVGDYIYSRDQTEYVLNNQAATAQDLPDTFYRRHELQLDLRYRIGGGFEITGRYGFDQFRVDDFANENIPLAGFTGPTLAAIYLGDSIQDYNAHRIALLASRNF
jgi:MtrB/PioB family decaheme-associated outer membrane protein